MAYPIIFQNYNFRLHFFQYPKARRRRRSVSALRADIFVINLWTEFNTVRGIHAVFVGVAHEESWRQEVRIS